VTAGFAGTLGVVRLELAHGEGLASLPEPVAKAQSYVEQLTDAIAGVGDAPTLLSFDAGNGLPCFFRARDVVLVDVVPTEDPGAER
jgi:hypothetical protein